MTCIYLICPIWKATPALASPPTQPFPSFAKLRLELVALICFKVSVAHDFPNNFLYFSHEHCEVLVTVSAALSHIERFDHFLMHCTRDSFV